MTERRHQTIRPRVFVSSVVDGFEQFREAARRGIEQAGGEPLLLNEDLPALAGSPRNACLDGVDSSDIYLVIIGSRGGWQAPSGKLVVEEEYERARIRKLPTLAFIQAADRDEQAEELVNKLSDYVDGAFRVTFQTPAELQAAVTDAISHTIRKFRSPIMDKRWFQETLASSHAVHDEATLRLAIAPERDEELIDPLNLDQPDFIDRLYEIGHNKAVRLFDYREPKRASLGDGSHSTVVLQEREQRRDTVNEVRLEIFHTGRSVIDANVTGRLLRGDRHNFVNSMYILESDVEAVLRAMFSFVSRLLDEFDRFKRHDRFFYNVSLSNVGHRSWVKEVKEQTSYSMPMRGENAPFTAFEPPRVLTRSDLQAPDQEITRALTMLQRKIQPVR